MIPANLKWLAALAAAVALWWAWTTHNAHQQLMATLPTPVSATPPGRSDGDAGPGR